MGFSFTYSDDFSEPEKENICVVPADPQHVQVEFKNSKGTNKVAQESLQRVKAIIADYPDEPDATKERYLKALESKEVLTSHKLLLLLFIKPIKAEWPFAG